ncbi:MAG: hypothetical protein E7596_00600 [Ruminococcaceae bacterium]|nr:hypothetical protein [Oscillospiraceae bacterium]
MVGWFRKRKEFKESQKHHKKQMETLCKINFDAGVPTPENWINEEYHSKVYNAQKSLKRVLTSEEKKAAHKEASNKVLDFVNKHLFPLG